MSWRIAWEVVDLVAAVAALVIVVGLLAGAAHASLRDVEIVVLVIWVRLIAGTRGGRE